jgi:hypothetical protein
MLDQAIYKEMDIGLVAGGEVYLHHLFPVRQQTEKTRKSAGR